VAHGFGELLHIAVALRHAVAGLSGDAAGIPGVARVLGDPVGDGVNHGGQFLNGGRLLSGALRQRLRPVGNLRGAARHLVGGAVDLPQGAAQPHGDLPHGIQQSPQRADVLVLAAGLNGEVAVGHRAQEVILVLHHGTQAGGHLQEHGRQISQFIVREGILLRVLRQVVPAHPLGKAHYRPDGGKGFADDADAQQGQNGNARNADQNQRQRDHPDGGERLRGVDHVTADPVQVRSIQSDGLIDGDGLGVVGIGILNVADDGLSRQHVRRHRAEVAGGAHGRLVPGMGHIAALGGGDHAVSGGITAVVVVESADAVGEDITVGHAQKLTGVADDGSAEGNQPHRLAGGELILIRLRHMGLHILLGGAVIVRVLISGIVVIDVHIDAAAALIGIVGQSRGSVREKLIGLQRIIGGEHLARIHHVFQGLDDERLRRSPVKALIPLHVV